MNTKPRKKIINFKCDSVYKVTVYDADTGLISKDPNDSSKNWVIGVIATCSWSAIKKTFPNSWCISNEVTGKKAILKYNNKAFNNNYCIATRVIGNPGFWKDRLDKIV